MRINKRIFKNIIYLSLGQGITFIAPLLIAPRIIYLTGLDNYGKIITMQAIISYISIITEYGFNLTGVKQVAINRSDMSKLNNLVTEVLLVKLFLAFGMLVLSLVVFLVLDEVDCKFFYLSFFIVLGRVLSLNWFFQGLEKNEYLSFLSFLSKVISIFLIYLFVLDKSDYVYVNFFLGIGDILTGIFSLFFSFRVFNFNFQLPNISTLIDQLKNGFSICITNFANNVYLNSNIIILGFFVNSTIVGSFAIAEKVMVAIKQVAVVILQATYPHACKLAENSLDDLKSFLKKELFFFASVFLILGVILFIFAENILLYFVDQLDNTSVLYLKFLCFIPFIVSLNMPAYKMLIIQNLQVGYLNVIFMGTLINLMLNIILGYHFFVFGTIFSMIFTELFITLGFYWYLNRYKTYSFIS